MNFSITQRTHWISWRAALRSKKQVTSDTDYLQYLFVCLFIYFILVCLSVCLPISLCIIFYRAQSCSFIKTRWYIQLADWSPTSPAVPRMMSICVKGKEHTKTRSKVCTLKLWTKVMLQLESCLEQSVASMSYHCFTWRLLMCSS